MAKKILIKSSKKESGADLSPSEKLVLLNQFVTLVEIGRALSSERDLDKLLEMIMDEARHFTHADGGTLYILEGGKLHFKIVQNESLGIRMGGKASQDIPFLPVTMDKTNVSAYVAMTGQSVNIPDVYHYESLDFSGPKQFDQKFNYRTQSMLVVPMKNHDEEVIGAIQLMNARGMTESDQIIPFSHYSVNLIESLASQAAIAISNVSLINSALQANEEIALARDRALKANEAKNRFLANISHEFRTPLNAIIGFSEMLMEEVEERDLMSLHDDLEKISSSGKYLLELINQILDLSKVEAGKMEISLESFNTRRMVENITADIKPLAGKNKNTLEINFSNDLGSMVADPTKLKQSLTNLLSNACKFCENGTVSLDVHREKKGTLDWISFKVTDTGIGIPEDQMENIFLEFSQGDSSTTRKYGGTGLGLAISQRYCRMMGGDITVQSKPGKGSTFTIHLPVKVVPFSDHPRRRASDAE